MATTQSYSKTKPTPRIWLWSSLLAGPVIWSIYFMLGYFLSELVCKSDWLSEAGLTAMIIGLTLIATALSLVAGFLSYRSWGRTWGAEEAIRGEQVRVKNTKSFLMFAGAVMSFFFALVILLTGLPAFFLQPCIY